MHRLGIREISDPCMCYIHSSCLNYETKVYEQGPKVIKSVNDSNNDNGHCVLLATKKRVYHEYTEGKCININMNPVCLIVSKELNGTTRFTL